MVQIIKRFLAYLRLDQYHYGECLPLVEHQKHGIVKIVKLAFKFS